MKDATNKATEKPKADLSAKEKKKLLPHQTNFHLQPYFTQIKETTAIKIVRDISHLPNSYWKVIEKALKSKFSKI